MKVAAIGIGSNSVRMLLIETQGESFRRLRRDREGTRLFAGLDESGNLSQSAMDATIAAVARMAREARDEGAEKVHLFATSATRDAGNQAEFARRLLEEAQVELEICSGTREATLSFIGATDGGHCGVIDIGGGSTEFTLGEGSDILGAISLQIGAVRMQAQQPILSVGEYEETVLRCRRIIARDAKALLAYPPRAQWVGVGGTMTTLGAMERRVPLFDPDTCEGMRMRYEQVCAWGRKIAAMSMDARRHVEGLMPHRADIIPSGIAILEAAMVSFSMPELVLSAHGNMDGFLKKKFSTKC